MIRDSNASSVTTSSSLRQHAFHGAAAGLTYGIAERLLASVVPWLLKPAYVYQPPNPAAVIALLAFYGLGGGLLQVVLALGLRGVRREVIDLLVRLAVVAFFAVNFVVEYLPPFLFPNRKIYAAAFIGQIVGVALLACSELLPRTRGRLVIRSGAISMLLLLPWYLIIDVFSARRFVFKAVIACSAVAAVILLAFLQRRVPPRAARVASFAIGVAVIGIALLAPQSVDATAPPKSWRPAAGRPNIVLITLDTVRADHLSVYGYARETTPALVRFARQATVYTSAFSSGDMTLSTHASLFTGLEPRSHGAHFTADFQFGRPLASTMPTLGEMLASRGYDTVGVVANAGFLGHAFGLNRGFRYYDQRVDTPFFAQSSEYFIGRGVMDAARRLLARDARFVSGRMAAKINRDVRAALQTSGGRFFLFINYLDAHWPYHSPAPFSTMFPAASNDAQPDDYLRRSLTHDAPPEYCDILIARYDGAIRYLDGQVGDLLDELRRRGLYDDALIVITSDHGEAFGERGQLSHGVSVFENQIRVPLIVKMPHQQTARTISEPISSVGVFNMIAAAAGAAPPATNTDSTVMAEHFDILNHGQIAITDGKLKLIRNASGTLALYDLVRDPLEKHDLSHDASYASRAAELGEHLEVRIAAADRERQRIVTSSNIDESYLRSLGYLR